MFYYLEKILEGMKNFHDKYGNMCIFYVGILGSILTEAITFISKQHFYSSYRIKGDYLQVDYLEKIFIGGVILYLFLGIKIFIDALRPIENFKNKNRVEKIFIVFLDLLGVLATSLIIILLLTLSISNYLSFYAPPLMKEIAMTFSESFYWTVFTLPGVFFILAYLGIVFFKNKWIVNISKFIIGLIIAITVGFLLKTAYRSERVYEIVKYEGKEKVILGKTEDGDYIVTDFKLTESSFGIKEGKLLLDTRHYTYINRENLLSKTKTFREVEVVKDFEEFDKSE